MEQHAKIPCREVIPVKWYSDLANLRHKVGNHPVLLVCDNAFAQIIMSLIKNGLCFS